MKNKLNVKIQRKSYTLLTEESQEYTDALSNLLDRRINERIKKTPSLSTVDAAFLTAFDCLDELYKANKNIDNIRSQIKEYVDDASNARKEAENAAKQLEEAQKKISLLREKNAALHAELKAVRSGKKVSSAEKSETEHTQEKTPAQSQQKATNYVGQVDYDPKLGGGQQ